MTSGIVALSTSLLTIYFQETIDTTLIWFCGMLFLTGIIFIAKSIMTVKLIIVDDIEP